MLYEVITYWETSDEFKYYTENPDFVSDYTQLPGYCVPTIMAYIAGGGNKNPGYYAMDYMAEYDVDFTDFYDKGVHPTHIEKFVQKHLVTEQFFSFEKAINEGMPVMIGIDGAAPDEMHNVLVLGYGPANQYVIMDTQTTRTRLISGDIDIYYKYVVKGVR